MRTWEVSSCFTRQYFTIQAGNNTSFSWCPLGFSKSFPIGSPWEEKLCQRSLVTKDPSSLGVLFFSVTLRGKSTCQSMVHHASPLSPSSLSLPAKPFLLVLDVSNLPNETLAHFTKTKLKLKAFFKTKYPKTKYFICFKTKYLI